MEPTPKSPHLRQVERLVEASPFKTLLRLPPEEVLDWLHSKAGQALLQGVAELKRRELDGLVSSKADPATIVGEMYEVRGIASLCNIVLGLEQQIVSIREAYKREGS